jgi:hypothetical protein
MRGGGKVVDDEPARGGVVDDKLARGEVVDDERHEEPCEVSKQPDARRSRSS